MMQLAGFFVPEEFWPDVGYEGDAVWVATWWEPGGDEACWGNGRSSATGEHRAYLTLMDYPPNRKLLHKSEPGRWSLGSSDTEATYRLWVNRETGAVFLAPLREADRVLREQWPQIAMEKPVSFTSQEELHELVQEAFELMRPMSQADIMEVMAQQEGRLAALRAALNRN